MLPCLIFSLSAEWQIWSGMDDSARGYISGGRVADFVVIIAVVMLWDRYLSLTVLAGITVAAVAATIVGKFSGAAAHAGAATHGEREARAQKGDALWARAAKPGAKTPLEDDDTVALLVAARAPRETHGALAAVSKRLARVVSSPALAKERAASGWLEGPQTMHRVSVRRLKSGRYRPAKRFDHEDPSPEGLFEPDVQRSTAIFCQLIVARRGADPDPHAALWNTFVELVDLFLGHHLMQMRMDIAPGWGDHLVGYSNFGEPRGGLGAGFTDHLVHHAIVIDYAAKHYDRADVGDKDALSLSWYGKRLCDLGLLREHYDETNQKWSIDADGWIVRDLRAIWETETGIPPDAACPVDAPMVVVFAYFAVMTQPDARERLEGRELMIGGYLDNLFHAKVFGNVLDRTVARIAGPRRVDQLLDPARRRMYVTAAARKEARADAERASLREEREREERRAAQREVHAEQEQSMAQYRQNFRNMFSWTGRPLSDRSVEQLSAMSRGLDARVAALPRERRELVQRRMHLAAAVREEEARADAEREAREREERRAAQREVQAEQEQSMAQYRQNLRNIFSMGGQPMGDIEPLSSDEDEDPTALREILARPERRREHFAGEDLPGDEEL